METLKSFLCLRLRRDEIAERDQTLLDRTRPARRIAEFGPVAGKPNRVRTQEPRRTLQVRHDSTLESPQKMLASEATHCGFGRERSLCERTLNGNGGSRVAEFSPDFKELVRSRTEIVGLISESLTLIPTGADYKALCPFHPDKNPSLIVYSARQSYRCWACQTGGDIFSWVMERENVGFREALEILANRAHIEIPNRSQYEVEQTTRKNDLYDVLKLA